MALPPKLKVLEHCKISPPPGSVHSTSLPLTFFDIPWLLFSPSQPLFFYAFPHFTPHFLRTILPNFKHSLSFTLQHFFPFAGNLIKPPQPTKPHLYYTDGDSISLTIAESTADFSHLSDHHQGDAKFFHHLVPKLQAKGSSDPYSYPLLAIQVTLFPGSGICIGFTYRSVVADGRTFHNFLKCWASVCKMGANLALPVLKKLLPCYDKSVIDDPKGLEPLLLKEWWKLRSSEEEVMDSKCTVSDDMVRATFVVGRPEMEKIKKGILTRSKRIFGSQQLLLSPYVLACAFLWVCWAKTHWPEIESSNEPHYFGFVAGGITRLDYSVPMNYFGNCVAFGRSIATRHELLGEDGIAIAAKVIGNTIKKLNGEVLADANNWILDWKEIIGSELHVMVTGSPKLDLYGLDFGWGRPGKIEEASIERTRALSLCQSVDLEGGIEVGVVLPMTKMHAFGSFFNEDLKSMI